MQGVLFKCYVCTKIQTLYSQIRRIGLRVPVPKVCKYQIKDTQRFIIIYISTGVLIVLRVFLVLKYKKYLFGISSLCQVEFKKVKFQLDCRIYLQGIFRCMVLQWTDIQNCKANF
jgi:hypothetical protein